MTKTPSKIVRVSVCHFPKGRDQGSNEHVGTFNLPYKKKQMLYPKKQGCCSSILEKATIGYVVFQGCQFVVSINDQSVATSFDAGDDYYICLHGDYPVKPIRPTPCPHCGRV
jgi:hypothetical protein